MIASLVRLSFLAALAVAPAWAEEGEGEGAFAISCTPAAQERFDHGVALLHAFSPEAAETFAGLAADEPDCAMAHWGIAMSTRGNPFGALSGAAVSRGRAAIERARAIAHKTPREADWIDALGAYFDGSARRDRASRARLYEAAMARLRQRYPDDSEIQIFYALALNEAADPTDTTYARQLKAAVILENLEGKLLEHPGIPLYLVHSYDHPLLATKGEPAARRLAAIAPESAYARHLPSRIFSRLGLWSDAIKADVAASRFISGGSERHPILDALANAYLQRAQDRLAKRLVDEVAAFALAPPDVASAALLARYALERGDWAAASRLEAAPDERPHAAAVTWFARALGAARSRDLTGAREAVEHLTSLRYQLLDAGDEAWARQVEIYETAATAWTLQAEGKRRDAFAVMRSAADLEGRSEGQEVLVNRLVPMRELLGEMLLDGRQPALALAEFTGALRIAPNRFRSLAGAAKAAERMGREATATARLYHGKLLELAADSDGERPEIEAARRFLNKPTQTASGN